MSRLIALPDPADSPHMGMRSIAHDYTIDRVRRGEITASTGARIRQILRSFADSYGKRPVANISRRDIEGWQAKRAHLAPATRRHEFSTLRCFLRHLVNVGTLRRDPTLGMKAPKVPRAAGRALSRDECEALERALPDHRARAIYALMRWVGLRRAEVIGLELGDWDRRAGVIRVVGKGGHERIEPVPLWVAEPLASYIAHVGATAGPIVRTLDGTRGISNNYLGRLMTDWMNAAGIKDRSFDGRGCHSLRHTIASELIESGADIATVQELLGHVSLTSTQVYLRRASAGRILDAMTAARLAA